MPDDLRRIHEETLIAVDALEAVLGSATPDRVALADARWKLTRIGMRRNRAVETLYGCLRPLAVPTEALKLTVLQAEYPRLRAASAAHIGRWTLDRIMDDWDGYRAASAEMRASIRARIAAEMEVLYPLIDRMNARTRSAARSRLA